MYCAWMGRLCGTVATNWKVGGLIPASTIIYAAVQTTMSPMASIKLFKIDKYKKNVIFSLLIKTFESSSFSPASCRITILFLDPKYVPCLQKRRPVCCCWGYMTWWPSENTKGSRCAGTQHYTVFIHHREERKPKDLSREGQRDLLLFNITTWQSTALEILTKNIE